MALSSLKKLLANNRPSDEAPGVLYIENRPVPVRYRSNAQARGRKLITRLRQVIPRHQFEIPLQVAIGGKIIARETIKPFRKDVTAKLYGGDVTRKMKVLKRQKEGKKRMKNIGSVNIPQEAFMSILDTAE